MGEIDPYDVELLSSAEMKTCYPKSKQEELRLERLTEDGYLRRVRRSSQHSGVPPMPIGYELTPQGTAFLAATRHA
ncbi:MAG: hypothetical protein ACRD4P_17545 [Bryobacteraceae bacterium]